MMSGALCKPDAPGRRAILIHDGTIVDPSGVISAQCDILIENGKISAIGPDLPRSSDREMMNASNCLIIPGLINSHTHSHNNLMRGCAENWTLEDLRNFGPSLYYGRSAEDQYLSTAIGAIEMLETGCTAAYDQFAAVPFHTEEGTAAVIQAYEDVGLRAVVAPAIADIPFYRAVPFLFDLLPGHLRSEVERMQGRPAAELIDMNRLAVKRWDGSAEGRIRMATAPLIPGECSDELLAGCRDIVADFGVTLHTHMAETKIQAVGAQKRWGKPMVSHLADLGLLGPGFVGGHGVWVTGDDIELLRDHGAKVTYNPASNMRLGSGLAPIREMLDNRVTVSVATDGSMSSDNQNMFEAMRIGCLLSAVRFPQQQHKWIDAWTMLRMATSHGASVLGQEDRIGSIKPGYCADLVLLRTDQTYSGLQETVANQLVFASSGLNVDRVLVDGRLVVKDGQVLGVDKRRIYQRARESAERLRHAARQLRSMGNEVAPYLLRACATCASYPFPVDRWATNPVP